MLKKNAAQGSPGYEAIVIMQDMPRPAREIILLPQQNLINYMHFLNEQLVPAACCFTACYSVEIRGNELLIPNKNNLVIQSINFA